MCTSDDDVQWQTELPLVVKRGSPVTGIGEKDFERSVELILRGRHTEITPYDSMTEISIFLAPV